MADSAIASINESKKKDKLVLAASASAKMTTAAGQWRRNTG